MKTKLSFMLLFATIISNGQQKITGIITNFSEPIEEVNITNLNTSNGTISDAMGVFQITAKKGDTLAVSHISYETQKIVVSDLTSLNIGLEANTLTEVLIEANSYWRRRCCCNGYSVSVSYVNYKPIEEKIKMYPNPSDGNFQLHLPKAYNEVKIQVINLTGQLLLQKNFSKWQPIIFDISNVPSGIYLVSIEADGEQLKTLKALKK